MGLERCIRMCCRSPEFVDDEMIEHEVIAMKFPVKSLRSTPCVKGAGSIALLLAALVCSQLFAAGLARAQAAGASATAAEAKLLALGQRIYREGVRASGETLTAVGSAQMQRSGKDAACIACHRRSGYGATEGKFVVRPITGPALTQEQTLAVRSPRIKARLGSSLRPPYTDALLARAIRTGIDAAGKPLDTLMPRYALTDEEMKALAAYLFSLSAQDSPGVDDKEIHFATVIQPGVATEKRRAMLDIMQAFVKDKDANVRADEQRREAGNMRMYRSYRKWVLHVWELSGASETWGAQLEAYYAKQPVFALVGGLGTASWRPIHEFSERFEIPCVFPQVDLPVVATGNNYTIYYSRGVVLEAEVLAKFLRDQGEAGKIVQVYRREDASAAAAAAFRAALKTGANSSLEDQVLEGPATEAFWQTLAGVKPDALVLWLGTQDVAGAVALGPASPAVYLSFNLLGGKRPGAAPKEGANIRLIYPSDLPPKHEARLLRNKHWLHSKGIAIVDETVQINTQYAMVLVSDVLGHIMDSFSRDLFVERLEHAVAQTPMASVYPQVSLGPGQRFAAKGSSIVQIGTDEKTWKAISPWIVP
jgi:mono/diheme cytochrome c family protein